MALPFHTLLNMLQIQNMHFQEQIIDEGNELTMSEITTVFMIYSFYVLVEFILWTVLEQF